MVKIDFQKTPQSIVDYLKNKQLTLTYNHYELLKKAHDKAFTVAKVTRMDLLNDIHSSLIEAIKTGRNFEAWKKSIIPTLEKKGWWGTQEIADPKTGELKEIVIGSRRLKTIYDTNLRVAYQKYRYEEMMKLPLSTYWMYRSALLENTRDSHRKLHGSVFHRDHEFWQENYPPNDWNCKCTVTAHSKKDIEKRGLTPIEGKIESIAGKDWNYNVGINTNVAALKKINLDDSLQYLPLLNSARNNELKNLDYDGLKNRFYQSIGVKEGETFIDKTNDPILISDDFFKTLERSKINRKDRNYYILELADTLQNPDEIYLEFEKLKNTSDKYLDKDSRVVKKYMRYYKTEKGAKRALIVLVEYLKDKTAGVSAYVIDSAGTVENKRVEKLIYKKD
ncbi:phage minor head protein [Arcobacter cryaerophilus gv. pseudocryaerophilus]|uniref:Phage minor head protein n=3 Tax=Arcobacteraceae TaxID=2808963 RepID=A0AA96DUR0_9BACT|nr:phage minor head protein [Arcobacter sp. AZ-2023]WNL36474.1 phage minor head protein [Arcobacter sp. AZ-2023]WPD12190.1 phage minor head protein [Arcobacter sp. DSM 115960]